MHSKQSSVTVAKSPSETQSVTHSSRCVGGEKHVQIVEHDICDLTSGGISHAATKTAIHVQSIRRIAKIFGCAVGRGQIFSERR